MTAGLQLSESSARLYAASAENAAQIVAKINASTGESEIHLDADKVYIGNSKSTTVINGKCSLSDVTADYIDSKIATLSVLHGISASFTGSLRVASAIYLGSDATDVSKNLATAIKELNISQSGNTYTLQKKSYNDSDWQDVGSFSRATTLTGSWSGGTFEVTASPQGNTNATTLRYAQPTGNVSISGNVVMRTFNIQYGPDDDHLYNTGFSPKISIDASDVYTNGFNADHTLTIDDVNGIAHTTYTVPSGGTLEIWPGMTLTSGGKKWGSKVTVTGSGGTITVDNWSRTAFDADSTARSAKSLSIPISVDVNGTTYSNTFTTPDITLERYANTYYANVKCGSRIIARLFIDGFD